MATVAIIGANSFLASRLRKRLRANNQIAVQLYGSNSTVLSPNEICFDFYLPAHKINYESLLICDVILYCAGAGIQSSVQQDPSLVYEVNTFEPIRMFLYLQEKKYTGKVITFGSYFEIGNNNERKIYSEEDVLTSPLPVVNEYARSKKMLSQYVSTASFTFKNYHLILGSIYGKGENENRLIPYLIKQLQNNQPVHLSSGEQIRQYIHVDDVLGLIIQLVSTDIDAGIYNVSSDDSISVKELSQYICKRINAAVKIEYGNLSKTDQKMGVLILSNEKIKTKASWSPSISLEEGITEYLNV